MAQVGTVHSLEEHKVIGDVIDSFQPQLNFELIYGATPVVAGTALRVEGTSHPPVFKLGESSNKDDLFALLMVDPDAPSPNNPVNREYLHWIVTNIPSAFDSTTKDLGSECTTVNEYMGPAPPEGRHRYVFLVYRQSGRLDQEKLDKRGKFSARSFSSQHKLGNPVAANFFYAEKDAGPRV